MRLHTLLLVALLIVGPQSALSSGAPKPLTFADIQAWAGPDAQALDFNESKLSAFLQAWKADLKAGRQPQWSAWLKGLEKAKGPSLRAWALARRLEAGDFAIYGTFQSAITDHLKELSKPQSGPSYQVITNPPQLDQLLLPEALRINHGSVFWEALRKTLRANPERTLDVSTYAVWCYGTHPDQKDLILELAALVESSTSMHSPKPDPWNDPRFWIVVDWAMAWGQREDFVAILKTLPDGPARSTFQQTFHKLETIPFVFSEPTPGDSAKPALSALPITGPQLSKANLPNSGSLPIADFQFSQIKVLVQPPAPRFPLEAKARRLMTNLIVTMVVDPKGRPVSCRPEPGPWLGFFAPTGMEYGMQWRFLATEVDGIPQFARFRVIMPFRLGRY